MAACLFVLECFEGVSSDVQYVGWLVKWRVFEVSGEFLVHVRVMLHCLCTVHGDLIAVRTCADVEYPTCVLQGWRSCTYAAFLSSM